jgi:hypothetical protein
MDEEVEAVAVAIAVAVAAEFEVPVYDCIARVKYQFYLPAERATPHFEVPRDMFHEL